jgi:cytochrome c peroxidase
MNSKVALTFISAILLISCNKDVIVENDFEILDDNDIVKLANSNASLTSLERLGKAIYFDPRFSEPIYRQSCSSCHSPNNGWVGFGAGPRSFGGGRGAIAGIPEGAIFGKYSGRASPSAAYATFSPVFRQEKGEGDADFIGGLFWDGRATGRRIPGNPAAEQALGPLVSPVEQNHANPLQVLNKITTSESYLTLWNNAFGTRTIATGTAGLPKHSPIAQHHHPSPAPEGTAQVQGL